MQFDAHKGNRMYALTVDRRSSRTEGAALDMAGSRDRLNQDFPEALLPWHLSAGDELQVLFEEAEPVIEAALALAETGRWHVGIGLGPVEQPLPDTVAEATGPCLVLARDAVDSAKKLSCRTAVRAPRSAARAARDADSLLALLSVMRQRRTDAAREAASYADQGMTQEQISQRLEIDQSSVSRRLRTAMWQEESEARKVLIGLLEHAHDRAASPEQKRPA